MSAMMFPWDETSVSFAAAAATITTTTATTTEEAAAALVTTTIINKYTTITILCHVPSMSAIIFPWDETSGGGTGDSLMASRARLSG